MYKALSIKSIAELRTRELCQFDNAPPRQRSIYRARTITFVVIRGVVSSIEKRYYCSLTQHPASPTVRVLLILWRTCSHRQNHINGGKTLRTSFWRIEKLRIALHRNVAFFVIVRKTRPRRQEDDGHDILSSRFDRVRTSRDGPCEGEKSRFRREI